MGFIDYVLIGLLLLAVVLSVAYIVKKKKSGGCIGCSSNNCGCSNGGACHCHEKEKK